MPLMEFIFYYFPSRRWYFNLLIYQFLVSIYPSTKFLLIQWTNLTIEKNNFSFNEGNALVKKYFILIKMSKKKSTIPEYKSLIYRNGNNFFDYR